MVAFSVYDFVLYIHLRKNKKLPFNTRAYNRLFCPIGIKKELTEV